MSDPIHIARDNILAPVGLEDRDIDRLLGQLRSPSIDAADIYFQSSRLQSWTLEDGIIKEGSFNIEQGAGVRAVSGEKMQSSSTAQMDEHFSGSSACSESGPISSMVMPR